MRKGDKLTAITSVCTHKKCHVKPDTDHFKCPCHPSQYSLDGKVIHGTGEVLPLVHYGVFGEGREFDCG